MIYYQFFFDYLLVVFGVLLSVAFFTLFERKVLGYIHFRKGPTKIFYYGLFQPFRDAIKLFCKEVLKGYKISFFFFLFGPLVGLFLIFVIWGVYISFSGVFGRVYSFIYFFCFISLRVYFLLFCGWGSGRIYSLLGCYRSVSQTISYEIVMIFYLFVFLYTLLSYDFFYFCSFQGGYWFFF